MSKKKEARQLLKQKKAEQEEHLQWLEKKLQAEQEKQERLDTFELNSKRVVVNGSSTQICLERYKTAIVFGTVNTVSQSLILISRNYKDQIDIKSLCGASETSITGNVNLENCASHSRYFSDELDAQNFYQNRNKCLSYSYAYGILFL